MKTYVHGLIIEPHRVKEDTVAKCLQAIKDHYIAFEVQTLAESRAELDDAELLDYSDKEMHNSIIEECKEIIDSIQSAKSMIALEIVLQTIYDCNIHIVEEKFNTMK